VVEHLLDHVHCWAFDERGHGASESPADDSGFDWARFGEDALAVVAELGLRRPFAAGHSCGGTLLLLGEMAAPGTYRGLWCYEPVVFPVDEPLPVADDNPLAVGARKRRDVFGSFGEALENFTSKPPMSRFHPDVVRAYVEHGFTELPGGGVRLRCRGEDEAKVYARGGSHGAFSRLGEVGCPVTLACGGAGAQFGPEVLNAMAARLPSAGVEVLDGLSHFGPLEGPEAVAVSIVRAFAGAPRRA
jgi:pimeloyl-ACP methyl ester carboxylesterase